MSSRVSVVVPTYNRKEWLAETVHSVLAQTYRDYEIIVADHGSDDGTAEMLARDFAGVRRVALEYCPLPACARNGGLRAATGEFVAFLDSDDLWFPEKLQVQMSFLDGNPDLRFVCSNGEYFGGGPLDGQRFFLRLSSVEGDLLDKVIRYNFVIPSSLVVSRAVLTEIGGFDQSPELCAAEDYHLAVRVARAARGAYLDRPLMKYRASEQALTQFAKNFHLRSARALERCLEDPRMPRRALRRAIAAHLRAYFKVQFLKGEPDAAAHLERAALFHPNDLWSRILRIFLACRAGAVLKASLLAERFCQKTARSALARLRC